MRTLSLFLFLSPMLAGIALAFGMATLLEPSDPLRHEWRVPRRIASNPTDSCQVLACKGLAQTVQQVTPLANHSEETP